MNLYQLTEQYLFVQEQCGEDDESLIMLLEKIDEDIKTKIINIATIIINKKCQIDALQKEEERLYSRRKAVERSIETLKKYILSSMSSTDKNKISDDKITVSLRSNPEKLKIEEGAQIPAIFQKEKISYEIDKNKIREAMSLGAEIPGCSIIKEKTIVIK